MTSGTEINYDDLIAEAEARVPTAVEAAKAATAAAKEAVKNHKAAVDYRKALAEDSDEIAEADETVAGWAAQVESTKAIEAQAKADVKAAKEAVKDAKKTKREAAKAEREEAKAAKEAAKAARVKQNGVLQPLPHTKCGAAWAVFDAVSAAKGAPATAAEAIEYAEKLNAEAPPEEQLNLGNVRAEYGQWRKFHGIPTQGRAKPAAPEAPAEEAASEEAAAAN